MRNFRLRDEKREEELKTQAQFKRELKTAGCPEGKFLNGRKNPWRGRRVQVLFLFSSFEGSALVFQGPPEERRTGVFQEFSGGRNGS